MPTRKTEKSKEESHGKDEMEMVVPVDPHPRSWTSDVPRNTEHEGERRRKQAFVAGASTESTQPICKTGKSKEGSNKKAEPEVTPLVSPSFPQMTTWSHIELFEDPRVPVPSEERCLGAESSEHTAHSTRGPPGLHSAMGSGVGEMYSQDHHQEAVTLQRDEDDAISAFVVPTRTRRMQIRTNQILSAPNEVYDGVRILEKKENIPKRQAKKKLLVGFLLFVSVCIIAGTLVGTLHSPNTSEGSTPLVDTTIVRPTELPGEATSSGLENQTGPSPGEKAVDNHSNVTRNDTSGLDSSKTETTSSSSATILPFESAPNITEIAFKVSGDLILDLTTPQGQATRWLLNEDGFPVPNTSKKVLQRYILSVLYFAMDGHNWTYNDGFLTESDECSGWYGVYCSGDEVVRLKLGENNLDEQLPSELSHLSELQILSMEENFITGTIPNNIGHMENLNTLLLYGNLLSGSIPGGIFNLTNLEVVGLGLGATTFNPEDSGNMLTGTLSTEIGNLKMLRWLSLSENELKGQIPKEMCTLPRLQYIYMYSMYDMKGRIPTEIGNLTELRVLDVSGTRLRRKLPTQIGHLSQLQRLDLSYTDISGEIPTELGLLSALKVLSLRGTYLTGSIPTEFFQLKNLEQLNIGSWGITGTIPNGLGYLSKLCALRLWGSLSGSLPPELGQLPNLLELELDGTSVEGPIPTELGQISTLEILDLSRTNITGKIPTELCNLAKLEMLSLGHTQLTGTLPTYVGHLKSLVELHLDDLALTGTLPTELGMLTSVETFYVRSTSLTGPIPTELGYLESMTYLGLSGAELRSSIPTELGLSKNLSQINLRDNLLSGFIPTELGMLDLWVLYLENNKLSGEIPTELGQMSQSASIHLEGNYLTGSVPAEICTIEYIWISADCKKEVKCGCCTLCCGERGGEMFCKWEDRR